MTQDQSDHSDPHPLKEAGTLVSTIVEHAGHLLEKGSDIGPDQQQRLREIRECGLDLAEILEELSDGRHPPNGAESGSSENPATETVHLDYRHLLNSVDNDVELLREITDLFFTNLPNQMEGIRHAITVEDAEELVEHAHSLKGAIGAFGKITAYDLAMQLEYAGRSGRLQGTQTIYQRLEKLLTLLRSELNQVIEQAEREENGES